MFMHNTRSAASRHQRHVVFDHDHGDAQVVLDVVDPEGELARFLRDSGPRPVRRATAGAAGWPARGPVRPPCARRRAGRPPDCCGAPSGPAGRSRPPHGHATRFGLAHAGRPQPLRRETAVVEAVAPEQQVVEHGAPFEQFDVLEGAGNAAVHHLVAWQPVMSWPSNCTLPEVASNTRVITLSIEVLPAPLGPMMANTSPCSTVELTLLMACTPPKRSDTLLDLANALTLICSAPISCSSCRA
jgi:hypothetical protein